MTAKPPGRVKLKKKVTASSKQWLERQLNDPYVRAAKQEGWRSRAAFKLIELDKKFHFLRKGARVLDLGSAPGGWSQVAAKSGALVVAADVLEMEPVPGVTFFQADLTNAATPALLQKALGGGNQFVSPQVGAVSFEAGDIFLLCTDGLFEALFDHHLEGFLRSPEATALGASPAQRLVADAVARQSRDNTTAVVIRVI